MTLNFWGTEAHLGRRLELARAQLEELSPDVVCMQEVRPMDGSDGRAGRTTAAVLADGLGMHHEYAVAVEWNDDDFFPGHPGGQEGLAILSKRPIVNSRVTRLPGATKTEARILLSVRVGAEGGDAWVHTTHLNYRLDDGLIRELQVLAIDDVIRGIDTDAAQIVCGDFNASPDSDEMRYMRGLTTLDGRRTHYQDAWLRCHPNDRGITWSSENPQTRPLRSLDIDRRIDFVYVTTRRRSGRGTIHDCQVVLDRRDEYGDCASDHYGVMADVQVRDEAA